MFTEKETIRKQLQAEGWSNISLEYIDRGVMTDTYKMVSGSRSYVIRCYPQFRSWLAKAEFEFLQDFARKGIKAPIPFGFSDSQLGGITYLIYEWVEGKTLREKYEELSEEERHTICNEVIDNYQAISRIQPSKFGPVINGRVYEHDTWVHFLRTEIEQSRRYFNREKDNIHVEVCDGLYTYTTKIAKSSANLVWSDMSLDNIIISPDNHLAAFIDFEGMVSGDPLLGISYLLSQEPDHPFTEMLIKEYGINKDPFKKKLLDFYAVFRYVRLAPYFKGLTPNNSERSSIDKFLPYVRNIEESFRGNISNVTRTK